MAQPKVPSRRLRRRAHGLKTLLQTNRHGRLASAIEAIRSESNTSQLVDVRLCAAFVATRSVTIEGCTVDQVVQTNTAQGLSKLLLDN